MRTLKFNVSGQNIKKDPNCDFNGIVKGTKGYLQTEFAFNSDWDGLLKIAEFRKFETSKPVPVAISGNKCMVPEEVTAGRKWLIDVIGKRGEFRITTNNVEVNQIE